MQWDIPVLLSFHSTKVQRVEMLPVSQHEMQFVLKICQRARYAVLCSSFSRNESISEMELNPMPP